MNAVEYLSRIYTLLTDKILFYLMNPIGICAAVFVTIITLIYNCVKNPKGAINTFMIHSIDIITSPLPSTPDNYKLSSMLSSFYAAIPQQIGVGVISEIMNGIIGMLGIYLIFKLYKSLPFT